MNKDFEDLLALFFKHGVKYLIVGGHAVAFHARPRFTQDIDLLVEPSAENAQRILIALEVFGFGSAGILESDLVRPNYVVQLGFPPNRIDIITGISGVEFPEAWAGKVAGTFSDQSVFYIGKAELIKNKKSVDRPQDREDIRWLSD